VTTINTKQPPTTQERELEPCEGENEQSIRIYRFENNGMGGPTEDSIAGIIENVRSELEHWADPEYGQSEPITLTITTGFMKRSEYDALPEFEGY
jgi:hypothetical protein